jgi:hypothetical protein
MMGRENVRRTARGGFPERIVMTSEGHPAPRKWPGARLHDCSDAASYSQSEPMTYYQTKPMAISGGWVEKSGAVPRETASQTNPLVRYDVLCSEQCRCPGRVGFPRTKPMTRFPKRTHWRSPENGSNKRATSSANRLPKRTHWSVTMCCVPNSVDAPGE